MCGIAGLMAAAGAEPPSFAELRRMVAMLAHRGPDGYGLYRDGRVGLGHARLSLIDLATGAQPLCNAAGTVWLTFNGEIFNYIELRRRLASLGHRFATKGDSEVIIHCFERYGPRAWEMLNGQFAFALWDSRSHRLWLVRDRLGILPLHYAVTPDYLLFASEAKALYASLRTTPCLDPFGLAETFVNWSTLAPRTVFQDVRQVPAATALCFGDNLESSEQCYWQLNPVTRSFSSTDEAADELEELLKRSVALRLRADVPVGAYISGGVDSSVIGSIASAKTAGLETFGIRFKDPRFDETNEQRHVVRHLATSHHEIMCDADAIRNALAETVWHCETPLLRTSPVPLFLLAGAVRAAGIKTILTGEGADELLCGYSIFKETQIRRFWARQPESRLRPALLRRLHHYVGTEDARANTMWQRFFARGLMDVGNPFYSHLIRWQNTAWTLRLLAPEIRSKHSLERMLAEIDGRMPAGWSDWDQLTRSRCIEVQAFMTSYLLACQGDRVAMAHGVEARYPFLDPDVVDFCFSLPKWHMLIGTRDKLALRRIARRSLPLEVCNRRKQPFRAPIDTATLASPDDTVWNDLTSPEHGTAAGLFDFPTVARLVAKARRPGGHLSEREEMGLVGIMTLRSLNDSFGPQFAARVRAAEEHLGLLSCDVFVDRLQNGTESDQSSFRAQ
jgi:asparagine synthase (glutamine-hydrolysing)